VYSIPLGGGIFREAYTIGGSGFVPLRRTYLSLFSLEGGIYLEAYTNGGSEWSTPLELLQMLLCERSKIGLWPTPDFQQGNWKSVTFGTYPPDRNDRKMWLWRRTACTELLNQMRWRCGVDATPGWFCMRRDSGWEFLSEVWL